MAQVPRVVTGAAVVDAVIPVVTSYAASAFAGMLLEVTDEVAQLFVLALLVYLLVSGAHEFFQWLALRTDGFIDGYERYLLYVVQLVQWFLFFLTTGLVFQWLTRFLAKHALMPWYEAVALGAVLIMIAIAYLPRTLMTIVAAATVGGGASSSSS
jgi:hypothetical protein